MNSFVMTPTEIEVYSSVFRDPITGKWTIPVLTFNTNVLNPFYVESDPLQNDPKYRKLVVDNIHTRLTEKWLYTYASFRSLCKYFIVDTAGNKGTVSMITNPDDASKFSNRKLTDSEEMYIFRYIEKYFATKKFVESTLKAFVDTTHTKWYDVFTNIKTVKDLFVHKLKKLIVNTIYELQKK